MVSPPPIYFVLKYISANYVPYVCTNVSFNFMVSVARGVRVAVCGRAWRGTRPGTRPRTRPIVLALVYMLACGAQREIFDG